MPANIRFKFYPSPKQVKLENKFSVLPLEIPLVDSMAESYKVIQSITKKIKGSLSLIYSMYALQFWSNMLLPRWVPKTTVDFVSTKFTMAFSNTPGPIKKFGWFFKGNQVYCEYSKTYMIVAGKIGLAVACTSFCDSFLITATADEGMFPDTERLVDLI